MIIQVSSFSLMFSSGFVSAATVLEFFSKFLIASYNVGILNVLMCVDVFSLMALMFKYFWIDVCKQIIPLGYCHVIKGFIAWDQIFLQYSLFEVVENVRCFAEGCSITPA